MGNFGTKVKGYLPFKHPKSYRILIVGLDAAGKTSLLYKLKLGEVVTTIPTIGFNVETIPYSPPTQGASLDFVMWDVGGRSMNTRLVLIKHYIENTSAIVLCVDSSDRERVNEVKDYLDGILREPEAKGIPLLVYANKQDLEGCMSPREVEDVLQLSNIKDRPYHVEGCSAASGEGLWEGMEWLAKQLGRIEVKSSLSAPVKETIEDGKSVLKSGTSWLHSVFCGSTRC